MLVPIGPNPSTRILIMHLIKSSLSTWSVFLASHKRKRALSYGFAMSLFNDVCPFAVVSPCSQPNQACKTLHLSSTLDLWMVFGYVWSTWWRIPSLWREIFRLVCSSRNLCLHIRESRTSSSHTAYGRKTWSSWMCLQYHCTRCFPIQNDAWDAWEIWRLDPC